MSERFLPRQRDSSVLLCPRSKGQERKLDTRRSIQCNLRLARYSLVDQVLDRIGDLLSLLLSGCTGVEDRWLDFAHVDCRLKIVDECLLALNASVGQLADLLRVEAFPHLAGEVGKKLRYEKGVPHVDEGGPHVAVVLKVDWQVEEVVPARVLLVQSLQKHLLRVLVWNVFNHDCRSLVTTRNNLLQV